MLARARPAYERLLPHGPADVAVQLLLFLGFYQAYSLVRGLAHQPGAAAEAFANARELMHLERTLNVFVEPSVQLWAAGVPLLLDAASWVYVNAQSTVMMGALAFLYFRRNGAFYFVRNALMVAMAIALVGYLAFPTAPPRFFPEWGFFDAVSAFVGVEPDSNVNALFNPYAAIPSMHVAFALIFGWALARSVRVPAARAWWAVYPFVVVFVIVATGNHFLIDAVLGAATAGVAVLVARALGRVRPGAWDFAPDRTVA